MSAWSLLGINAAITFGSLAIAAAIGTAGVRIAAAIKEAKA